MKISILFSLMLSGLALAADAPVLTTTIKCSPAFGGGHDVVLDIFECVQCSINQRYQLFYRNSSVNFSANGKPLKGDLGGGGREMLFLRVVGADHGEDYLTMDRKLVDEVKSEGKMKEIFSPNGTNGRFSYRCRRN